MSTLYSQIFAFALITHLAGCGAETEKIATQKQKPFYIGCTGQYNIAGWNKDLSGETSTNEGVKV